MLNFLFWDVDTQVDFLSPEGKLYVPGAEKILPNLRALTNYAAGQRIPIISSTDAHHENDPEFAQYPPHCLVGTEGQKKVDGTLLPQHFVVPNHKIELSEDLLQWPQLIVEKQALDVFTNPNLNAVLETLGKREVILYGVVTEICVDRAAHGLIQRGYRLSMVSDAVQHLDANHALATMNYIRNHGGQLVSTSELLTALPRPAAA